MHAARFAMLLALVIAPLAASAGPAPPAVLIACDDAVGIPGGIASVEVTLLRQEDAMVVGTQNDLAFDDERPVDPARRLRDQPGHRTGHPADKELQQNVLSDPPRVRGIIVALEQRAADSVRPAVHLRVPRRRRRREGSYPITNDNSSPARRPACACRSSGESCNIVVAAATATPTPTPRCRTTRIARTGRCAWTASA